MAERTYDRSTQDVGNLVALEHVNVTVPDQELAALFYVTGLGFTRDPYIDFGTANMWVNVGSQQFHLPKREAQVLRGVIGLVVPDIDKLRSRMAKLQKRYGEALAGTRFRCEDNGDGTLSITCPWGNRFRVQGATTADTDSDDPGPAGAIPLGMVSVDFDVAAGGAAGIARFYDEVIGAPTCVVDVDGSPAAHVQVGRAQHLRFIERTDPLPAYDGHHIAVYLSNFSKPYDALSQRGLISMETNEHEYRFQDIVDLDSGAVLATVEHEVRSTFHPMYGRELVNRNSAQNIFAYQQGHDAHVGLTHGGRG
ncbi:MAG: VOC family protein [Acidimicrobiales bacterium]